MQKANEDNEKKNDTGNPILTPLFTGVCIDELISSLVFTLTVVVMWSALTSQCTSNIQSDHVSREWMVRRVSESKQLNYWKSSWLRSIASVAHVEKQYASENKEYKWTCIFRWIDRYGKSERKKERKYVTVKSIYSGRDWRGGMNQWPSNLLQRSEALIPQEVFCYWLMDEQPLENRLWLDFTLSEAIVSPLDTSTGESLGKQRNAREKVTVWLQRLCRVRKHKYNTHFHNNSVQWNYIISRECGKN